MKPDSKVLLLVKVILPDEELGRASLAGEGNALAAEAKASTRALLVFTVRSLRHVPIFGMFLNYECGDLINFILHGRLVLNARTAMAVRGYSVGE